MAATSTGLGAFAFGSFLAIPTLMAVLAMTSIGLKFDSTKDFSDGFIVGAGIGGGATIAVAASVISGILPPFPS